MQMKVNDPTRPITQTYESFRSLGVEIRAEYVAYVVGVTASTHFHRTTSGVETVRSY